MPTQEPLDMDASLATLLLLATNITENVKGYGGDSTLTEMVARMEKSDDWGREMARTFTALHSAATTAKRAPAEWRAGVELDDTQIAQMIEDCPEIAPLGTHSIRILAGAGIQLRQMYDLVRVIRRNLAAEDPATT